MKARQNQETDDIRTTLAVLLNTIQNMESDIAEIREGIKLINGSLRDNQQDIVAIKTDCRNCHDQIDDLRKRMNVFSTLAAVGGGIIGYFGSYFK